MQLPITSSAAQIASIASQATSKGQASAGSTGGTEQAKLTVQQVEQSGDASADRDAQGQGDGMGERGEAPGKTDRQAQATSTTEAQPLAGIVRGADGLEHIDIEC